MKAGTNSHLMSLHAYVNNADHQVTAVRFWSGAYSVQDITTPAPNSKPFRLVNVPFYYIGQIDEIIQSLVTHHK